MAEAEPDTAVGYAAKTSSKSLSELIARVLEQLALSAWLPSAALTLLTFFVIELGTTLDDALAASKKHQANPATVLSDTLSTIGKTGISGLLLIAAAIIVLTMVTQAFSFEAIRLIEGYWGTNRVSERIAQARTTRWFKMRARLDQRYEELTRRAWAVAEPQIALRPDFTPKMVLALKAEIFPNLPRVKLKNPDKQARVRGMRWELLAPGDLLRRRTNLLNQLEDFPVEERHVMPTRLGNVLRHWEDETGHGSVQSMIDDVFDMLPASLQQSHDEQRGRLDLYCSMQFVMVTVGVVTGLRFAWLDWRYAAIGGAIALVSIWLLYRAATASARYYGSLLVTISQWVQRKRDAETPPPPPDPTTASRSWPSRLVARVLRRNLSAA